MKKKHLKTSRIFDIKIPIYNAVIRVTYGDDLKFLKNSTKDQPEVLKTTMKKIRQQLEELFKEKGKSGAFYCRHEEENIRYLHFFEAPDVPTLLSRFCHESLHATTCLLKDRGMMLTDESEEAYTYLQQYIFEELVNKIFELCD